MHVCFDVAFPSVALGILLKDALDIADWILNRMQLEQADARLSFFDLVSPGDVAVRLNAWVSQLFAAIDGMSGVTCHRLALNFAPFGADHPEWRVEFPKGTLAASDTGTARSEAFRLQRIAVAGALPGGENETSRFTAIVLPISAADELRKSWIEIEAKFLHQDQIGHVITQIGAALGWLFFLKSEMRERQNSVEDAKAVNALQAVVSLTTADQFTDAARALVTDIADRFKCDRVSLGFAYRKKIKLQAISHTGKFSHSMILVRRLRAAMEEAFDQNEVVLWPRSAGGFELLRDAQAELAEKDTTRSILTIPLFDGRRSRGAMVFERSDSKGFDQSEIFTLEALCGVLTPLLTEKRHNDRWLITRAFMAAGNVFSYLFGRRYFAVKLTAIALTVVAVLLVAIERPVSVVASAMVEGAEARTITAAFDGFISEVAVREGDKVASGDILLKLDDRDFNLERLRLLALRSQAELELDRAISARDRAETALVEARLRQVDAQLSLVEQQILRSTLHAPFDALIVSGDLTRSIGKAVSRGETLLILSPLNEYRVVLEAPESDIGKLIPGQQGQLKLSALPERNFSIETTDLVPVAQYKNNETVFSVETRLLSTPDVLLHGMTGSARIQVGEQPLYMLWGKPLWNQVREWAWRNIPI